MNINVVSPWFPHYSSIYSGVFVEKQVRAVAELGAAISVEVPTLFPAPTGEIPAAITKAVRDLASRDLDAMYQTVGDTTYVPTPVPSRSGNIGRARATLASLGLKREHAPVGPDVTHAHLAVPTGWACQSLGDSPLVVSEHQSTLNEVFSEAEASEAYRSVLERADAFICVSRALKDQISTHYGESATERVVVVPNIIDVEGISYEERPDVDLANWIYVGGLASHKGVPLLLKSFHLFRQSIDSSANLTLVGDGPLRRWIERYATSKGMRSAVDILGPIEHSNLGVHLKGAGLMVHLSPRETFGIAPLEAIASGLPVVSLQNGGAESTWGDFEDQCGVLLPKTVAEREIVDAIARLSEDSGRLAPRAGRKMVEERFSASSVAHQLMEIYASVAK